MKLNIRNIEITLIKLYKYCYYANDQLLSNWSVIDNVLISPCVKDIVNNVIIYLRENINMQIYIKLNIKFMYCKSKLKNNICSNHIYCMKALLSKFKWKALGSQIWKRLLLINISIKFLLRKNREKLYGFFYIKHVNLNLNLKLLRNVSTFFRWLHLEGFSFS